MPMLIESVFENHQPIPAKYTCDGENVSPALQFMNVPDKAKSLAIIVDDPDAPRGTFDHWIIWNLPPDVKKLSEGATEIKHLTSHPKQGSNGYQENKYKGPCPPPGKPHRYFFKLYALDALLTLPEGVSKQELENAMKGHILEKAELIGTYQH